MSIPIYQRVAVTDAGDIIPGAEYTVINENTGLAFPIYSDRAGTALKSAPYFADANGVVQFYIAAGTTFRVTATGGVGSYTDRYVYAAYAQEASTDAGAGRIMTVGAFGVGSLAPLNASIVGGRNESGFFRDSGATLFGSIGPVLNMNYTAGRAAQFFGSVNVGFENRFFGRTQNSTDTWSSPAEFYTTSNALNNVTETGGVPTGGLIESGSNGNGSYTKFADGTMICRYNFNSSTGTPTALGNVFAYNFGNWTFPASFIDTTVSVSSHAQYLTGANPISTTTTASTALTTTVATALFQVTFDAATAGTSVVLRVLAIGRWF